MSQTQLLGSGVQNSIPAREQFVDAVAMQATETNIPPPSLITGSNSNIFCRPYDVNDATTWKIFVPDGVRTSSTLTLRIALSSEIAAADKNVQFRFGYYIVSDGETWDQTYTNVDSSDIAMDATQDDCTIATWTTSLPAAFVAGDLAFYKLTRIAASANELTGAVRVLAFQPEILRS